MANPPARRDELIAFLERVRILDDPIDGRALMDARAEMVAYVRLHARAAELSLTMLARHLPAGQRPRVLELGAAPYYFSALMHRTFDADLKAVNVQAAAWPGEPATVTSGVVTLAVPWDETGNGGRRAAGGMAERRLAIDVRVANIEKDPFPFETDSFDAVLCMEVLEHLGYSPSHMLAESHRVLVPGGLLFVTVPNLINVKRAVRMVLNRTTEVPYSGYGMYGRHQREFAPGEVVRLLTACNFEVVALETANIWPVFRDSKGKAIGNWLLNAITNLPLGWLAAKREYILCAGRASGEPVAAYPSWLYTHRHLYPDPPHGVRKVITD